MSLFVFCKIIVFCKQTCRSFSSFFNPLDENAKKSSNKRLRSNTPFMDSRDKVKNSGCGNTAEIPQSDRQTLPQQPQPWNARGLEPTAMTTTADEHHHLWSAGLVSEFRAGSTCFSRGKSSSLPPPWSSKVLGLQKSLTRTDTGTW